MSGNVLDSIDLLGRLDAWIAMLRYGSGVELRWVGTGAPVIKLLRRYGIRTYNPRMPSPRERSIRVPAQQGRWAEYLCKRAGVSLTSDPIDHHNANVQPGPLPPAWGVPARGVGLFGLFSGIMAPVSSQASIAGPSPTPRKSAHASADGRRPTTMRKRRIAERA